MRLVILVVCLSLLGCSGSDDAPKLVLTSEATVTEQSATVSALERWQVAAGGLELYQPVVADRGEIHDTVVHVRDDDPGKLGGHGYGHVYLYRPPIGRYQEHAGGYDAMFEAVALHELGHQLGGANTDQPTGGIMGVDFAEPEDWRLCITQADLDLVCPKAGCIETVPEDC